MMTLAGFSIGFGVFYYALQYSQECCSRKKRIVFCFSMFFGQIIHFYLMQYEGIAYTGYFILYCALLYGALCDYLFMLIPDRTHVLIFAGTILITPSIRIMNSVGFLFLSWVLFSIFPALQNRLGGGDMKLIASFLIFLSPYQTINAIAISSTIASILHLPGYLIHTEKRKEPISFGPYLCFASFLCTLF